MSVKDQLREKAAEIGFLDARVASTVLLTEVGESYRSWVASDYHGEMTYLERFVNERTRGVEHVLPGARSVIVLAASYWYPEAIGQQGTTAAPGELVRVARYALGKDYHYVLKDRLTELVSWLDSNLPDEKWRICVDSAPVMERSYAAASGLGFIGKNGMLISWLHGSYTLLAEILTTAVIEPDAPREGTCGNCTRCLDACPTDAFVGPGRLDARKCISYLTIEKKSQLTDTEVAATGEWAFGCDICQDVCPYNKMPAEASMTELKPGTVIGAMELVSTFMQCESNSQFERRFAGSPILRAGRRRVRHLLATKRMRPSKKVF